MYISVVFVEEWPQNIAKRYDTLRPRSQRNPRCCRHSPARASSNANICGLSVSMFLLVNISVSYLVCLFISTYVVNFQQSFLFCINILISFRVLLYNPVTIIGLLMAQTAIHNFDVYQPRNPKASAYYKCVP